MLRKPREKRNDKEMEKTFIPIIHSLKFFQDRKQDLIRKDLLEIILNMKYQFREAGEAVFYQGERGQ